MDAASDRFKMLEDDRIDVLCDPVTMRFTDPDRYRSGIFSPIIFTSGISYLRRGSRAGGAPIYVGYVGNTTSEPLAYESCGHNLFQAIPTTQHVAIEATCAMAKAQARLAAVADVDVNSSDFDSRLKEAIAAAEGAVELMRTEAERPVLDSFKEYQDGLRAQVAKIDVALGKLKERAARKTSKLGARETTEAVLMEFGAKCNNSGSKLSGAPSLIQYRLCRFREPIARP